MTHVPGQGSERSKMTPDHFAEEFDGPKNDAGEPWGRNRRAAVLAKLNAALGER